MKKIGIPGWTIDGKYFGVTLPYAEFIRKFGQLIILTPDEPVRTDLDLLVLPGGADISPELHKHPNTKLSLYTGPSNSMLDYFDRTILPDYIDRGTPIFGICRGSQLLWTHFGGMLCQHFPNHTQSSYPTEQCHPLSYSPEYLKYNKLLSEVNSRHHQAMIANKENPAPSDLEVIAFGAEESKTGKYYTLPIVEIFKHKTLPIIGYQSHPEDMYYDSLTPMLIKELLLI